MGVPARHLIGGLSPLARGTPHHRRIGLLVDRFIPAGAGNTGSTENQWHQSPVYPRWRGEHVANWSYTATATGLSPLARGTHASPARGIDRPRFIPAGAGNTRRASWRSAPKPVYPRWRGEHNLSIRPVRVQVGLSPLARGTRNNVISATVSARFIPAGAGNTCATGKPKAPTAVYPRWRGEHSDTMTQEIIRRGLSPLARGTRTPAVRRSPPERFIPAGTGNTRAIGINLYPVTVYPRWHGEHLHGKFPMMRDRGLSPLARGTLCCPHCDDHVSRFIPAGAGNTHQF